MSALSVELATIARTDTDSAAALTAAWTRRQLVEVAVTLAAVEPERRLPVDPVTPIEARPKPAHTLPALGARYDAEEAAWTDDELRAAHAAHNRGQRNTWASTGERMYQRISRRRRRTDPPVCSGTSHD